MSNLETKYMGLTLRNPIIVGSSGLTDSVSKIKELEDNGAGAVVLKSIFEEQILMEANGLKSNHMPHAEASDLLTQYTQEHTIDEYLKLIENAKKAVSIPVIASINCVSPANWTSFAKRIQDRGADGLELNIFHLPGNYSQKSEDVEYLYLDIINEITEFTSIPIAIKMGFYFSALANMIFNLSVREIDAIVLFNRFYRPDIDLKKMELISSHIFSTKDELSLPLRWIGLLSGHAKCDLAASTGVHDGDAVLKCLLVGAKAVQVTSALYKHGPAHLGKMLKSIETWMQEHKYKSLNDFVGKLSHNQAKDPVAYERTQFMKYFSQAKI